MVMFITGLSLWRPNIFASAFIMADDDDAFILADDGSYLEVF